MAIQPNQFEDLARNVSALYEYLELAILEKITKRLQSGISAADWQVRKLNDLQNLQKELARIIASNDKDLNGRIYDIMAQVFDESVGIADQEYLNKLALQGQAVTTTAGAGAVAAGAATGAGAAAISAATLGVSVATENFGRTRTVAIEAYARNLTDTMRAANESIFRTSVDAYRKIISESAITGVGGVENRIQATQRALNKFADEGISSFTDRAGRRWGIQEYAEMATRTAIMRTAIDSTTERLSQLGEDLVIISDHPKECPLCRPWERKVLSISGTSTKYPPLARARAAGLFHPNCGHIMTIFTDGFTKIKVPEADAKGYELKQQQRYIERQIRKWKRREVVAITPEDKAQAKNKVQQWQGTMRAFIKTTGLDRLPERERILTGKPAVQKVNLGEIIKKTKPAKNNPKPKKKSLKDKVDELKGANVQTEEQARKIGKVILNETNFDQIKDKRDSIKNKLKELQTEFYSNVGESPAHGSERYFYLHERNKQIREEKEKLQKELADAMANFSESAVSKLSEIRALNSTIKHPFLPNSTSPAKKYLQSIFKYFPAEWIEKSAAFRPFSVKVSAKRAYYSDRNFEMTVGGSDEFDTLSTAAHEMTHRFEHVVPLIRQLEAEFYERRTQGYNLIHLGAGYKAHEKTKLDKFTNKYIGRWYGDGFYEVMTMGVEGVFFGKHEIFDDEELIEFVLGVLGAV